MTNTRLIALVVGAGLGLGCAASSTAEDPPGVVGTWDCSVESKTTYTVPASAPPYDGSGVFVLDVQQARGEMTLTRVTGSTGPTCPLRETLSADARSATLEPGQVCDNSVDNQISFDEGASSLAAAGDRLSGTYRFAVNGTTAAGAPLVGSGTASYICTRQ
jgi:hypothetical protein